MAHGIEFNLIRRKEERAYGSLGDLLTSPRHVRFIPNNGSWAAHRLHWLSVYEYSPERAPPLRLKDSTSAICFGASPMGARPSNGSPPAPDVAAKCGSWQGERDGSGEARCAWLESGAERRREAGAVRCSVPSALRSGGTEFTQPESKSDFCRRSTIQ